MLEMTSPTVTDGRVKRQLRPDQKPLFGCVACDALRPRRSDDCGVTRTAVYLQAAVSCGQVPGARESLPRSELLDRRIIRLGMPQEGKAADQDESCAAAQVSVHQNHLKPKWMPAHMCRARSKYSAVANAM